MIFYARDNDISLNTVFHGFSLYPKQDVLLSDQIQAQIAIKDASGEDTTLDQQQLEEAIRQEPFIKKWREQDGDDELSLIHI